ncbi:hypothetical protein DINM_004746 [Dirofilaria immitis]|nr:hypothetical protein [Dirofilaria immitis]
MSEEDLKGKDFGAKVSYSKNSTIAEVQFHSQSSTSRTTAVVKRKENDKAKRKIQRWSCCISTILCYNIIVSTNASFRCLLISSLCSFRSPEPGPRGPDGLEGAVGEKGYTGEPEIETRREELDQWE